MAKTQEKKKQKEKDYAFMGVIVLIMLLTIRFLDYPIKIQGTISVVLVGLFMFLTILNMRNKKQTKFDRGMDITKIVWCALAMVVMIVEIIIN